ncbi:hypothetical protein N8J89_18025 [Crossiella sp. CA-258035]|uniref:hypothetical protein n=1 Tax=Crossiella sp. CA-258035 TaxID=2981138 RepID=UPI0024BCA7C8|nr:hypothetical protein [Crossiella sp. CA-258035]WHT22891.1 hypothetical protein N8J89_18025 [Crossiella sp. CA-258035]
MRTEQAMLKNGCTPEAVALIRMLQDLLTERFGEGRPYRNFIEHMADTRPEILGITVPKGPPDKRKNAIDNVLKKLSDGLGSGRMRHGPDWATARLIVGYCVAPDEREQVKREVRTLWEAANRQATSGQTRSNRAAQPPEAPVLGPRAENTAELLSALRQELTSERDRRITAEKLLTMQRATCVEVRAERDRLAEEVRQHKENRGRLEAEIALQRAKRGGITQELERANAHKAGLIEVFARQAAVLQKLRPREPGDRFLAPTLDFPSEPEHGVGGGLTGLEELVPKVVADIIEDLDCEAPVGNQVIAVYLGVCARLRGQHPHEQPALLGVDPATVDAVLSGRHCPDRRVAAALAWAYGADPDHAGALAAAAGVPATGAADRRTAPPAAAPAPPAGAGQPDPEPAGGPAGPIISLAEHRWSRQRRTSSRTSPDNPGQPSSDSAAPGDNGEGPPHRPGPRLVVGPPNPNRSAAGTFKRGLRRFYHLLGIALLLCLPAQFLLNEPLRLLCAAITGAWVVLLAISAVRVYLTAPRALPIHPSEGTPPARTGADLEWPLSAGDSAETTFQVRPGRRGGYLSGQLHLVGSGTATVIWSLTAADGRVLADGEINSGGPCRIISYAPDGENRVIPGNALELQHLGIPADLTTLTLTLRRVDRGREPSAVCWADAYLFEAAPTTSDNPAEEAG